MLCQKCNHNNATVHFEQNINGKVTKMDLCPECAKELGIGANMNFGGFGGFNSLFDNFFGGLFEPVGSHISLSCNSCGEDMSSLSNSSFLGCSDCYDVFDSIIENSLGRYQRGTRHTGKRPGRFGLKRNNENEAKEENKPVSEIDKLKAELNEAVKTENYEKAAELRDKIKKLENK